MKLAGNQIDLAKHLGGCERKALACKQVVELRQQDRADTSAAFAAST